MIDSFSSLAAASVLWLAVLGIGRPLWRMLRLEADDTVATLVWSTALGLTATGWGLTLLATCGWFTAPLVALLSMPAAFWGLAELTCVAWEIYGTQRNATPRRGSQPWLTPATRWVPIAVAGILLALSLAPTTSPEALSGTLEAAKEICLSGSLEQSLGPRPAPTMASVWYASSMALDGPVAAGLLQWSFALLLAAATGLLARDVLGRAFGAPAAGVAVMLPAIQQQVAAPLEDLAAVAMLTLALVAWWQAVMRGRPRRWLLVAGALVGTAAAVKPVALEFGMALAVATLCLRPSCSILLRPAAIGGALLAMGLAVAWWLVCGSSIACRPAAEFDPGLVRGLGPLAVALLPGLLVVGPRDGSLRALRQLLVVVALDMVLGVLLVPQLRWWCVLSPALAVSTVWIWSVCDRFAVLPARLAQGALVVLIIVPTGMQLVAQADRLAVAVGWESREAFLLRKDGRFSATLVANQVLPSTARLLSQGRQTAYFRCWATDDQTAHMLGSTTRTETPRATMARLRVAGFTHVLLLAPAGPVQSMPFGALAPTDAQPDGDSAAEGLPLVLADYQLAGPAGRAWRCRLVQLDAAARLR